VKYALKNEQKTSINVISPDL